MRKIKNFFLKLLVLVIFVAMVGAMVIMLVNSRVKAGTRDDILFVVQGSDIEQIGRAHV